MPIVKCLLCLCLVLVSAGSIKADSHPSALENYLQRFHRSPKEMMNRLPPRVLANGTLEDRGPIPFPTTRVQENEFIDRLLKKTKDTAPHRLEKIWSTTTLAEPTSQVKMDDGVFTGITLEKNFISLIRQNLSQGSPEILPWADSYWPHALGSIASRYADPDYPNSSDWDLNFEYYRNFPTTGYFTSDKEIAQLSPAEKYDLFLGLDKGLTEQRWSSLQKSNSGFAEGIPRWHGLCDGWAAVASSGTPEPAGPVHVVGALGHKLTFYQSDIKALMTYHWTVSRSRDLLTGGRCHISNPTQDENGRITTPECFDANPMTWHLALTNIVGRDRTNFIFDSTYDYEVWNYPVTSYNMSFFNPQSLNEHTKINDAIEAISNFSEDKFKRYRSPKAVYVVGVSVDIEHLKSTEPHPGQHGAAPKGTLRYVYDLELDADHNIVGGEWYNNAHPDFLWKPGTEADASLKGDFQISPRDWSGEKPLPDEWLESGRNLAQVGKPMGSIVYWLLELSRAQPQE